MPSYKKIVWPAIRTIRIKLRHMPDVLIDASVAVDTGKPTVYLRIDGGDQVPLTPTEARRWAAGLVKAADCCDAKSAAALKIRSRPRSDRP